MKSSVRSPHNLGWVETILDKHHIDYLWKRVKERHNDMKGNLAGNIKESFALTDPDDWFFTNVLRHHVDFYLKSFGEHPIRDYVHGGVELHLKDWWVNHQYKHEFNPYHHHGGVYSFVVWLKIPTHWKEQLELPFLEGVKEDDKKASNFEFEYTDIQGGIRNFGYRLDPSREGYMLFFPAALKHTVYPFFNCDEARISVAGNLWLKSIEMPDGLDREQLNIKMKSPTSP